MYKRITIDRGVIALSGGINTNENDWRQQYLRKYFGATLSTRFDTYKFLSFSFQETGNTSHVAVRHSFASLTEFINFINTEFATAGSYNSPIELTLFMNVDTKILEPTLYAKNSKLGQLCGRNGYRTSRFVESDNDSSWDDLSIVRHLQRLWLGIFSEDLTETFIQNNPKELKGCFWTKRDCDKMGVLKDSATIEKGGSGRKLYNVNGSDPATNVVDSVLHSDALFSSYDMKVSTITTPKYYILDNTGGWNEITSQNFSNDLGDRVSGLYRTLSGRGYSVIAVHGIQINHSNGNTYRALYITPVGVDTVYFDYVDSNKTKVWAVKKAPNGTIRMNPLSFSTIGVQRQGRIDTGDWLMLDQSDTTSESESKGQGSTHFVYQDISSGKFSKLSESKMVQIKDKRFRVPFFHLVS